MSVVLMYHALYKDDDTSRISTEDLPYAVSEQNFIAQLDLIASKSVGVLENQYKSLPDIVLTFDDGHVSNFDIAMPLLAERGLSAYLFVTGNYVDTPHFCTGEQLQAMAEAGMVIGSHGMTHQFFDDFDDAQTERELRQSSEQLARQSKMPVQSISFPGGRYNENTLEKAKASGYAVLFGSGFGTVALADLSGRKPLNRVAIRRHTSLKEFEKIVAADPVYYTLQKGKQHLKLLIKKALGNRLYHGLYKSVSALK